MQFIFWWFSIRKKNYNFFLGLKKSWKSGFLSNCRSLLYYIFSVCILFLWRYFLNEFLGITGTYILALQNKLVFFRTWYRYKEAGGTGTGMILK